MEPCGRENVPRAGCTVHVLHARAGFYTENAGNTPPKRQIHCKFQYMGHLLTSSTHLANAGLVEGIFAVLLNPASISGVFLLLPGLGNWAVVTWWSVVSLLVISPVVLCFS